MLVTLEGNLRFVLPNEGNETTRLDRILAVFSGPDRDLSLLWGSSAMLLFGNVVRNHIATESLVTPTESDGYWG